VLLFLFLFFKFSKQEPLLYPPGTTRRFVMMDANGGIDGDEIQAVNVTQTLKA